VRRGLGLLVLWALLGGCGSFAELPGAGQQPVDEFDGDVRAAVAVSSRFWREEFPASFGRRYSDPEVAGPYVGRGGPTCAGLASVPFNAFYCPPQDFIAWDERLLAAGFSRVGDSWVYLIIAHEWAHAVQARLGRALVTVDAELQADCLAGAALAGAARAGYLTFEPGDVEELDATLAAVADDFPWTSEGDHGSAEQRIGAFRRGADGGVGSCLPRR
jgi:predicted metalloprotease